MNKYIIIFLIKPFFFHLKIRIKINKNINEVINS